MSVVQETFNKCQSGMHNHTSLIRGLRKVYENMDKKKFFTEFSHCLVHVLVIFKREPVVERAVEFIARFSASFTTGQVTTGPEDKENQEGQTNREEGDDSPYKRGESSGGDANKDGDDTEDDMHPFVLQLFTFLLEHHNAQDRAVRFRVCQLVNKMLSVMGDDATIDDALYEKIYDCMLVRLRDKFPVVRANAVLALSRLQDPTSKDCPIIEAYKFMLACDPNCDVRRAVLSCIAASTRTLSAILERTRDLKDTVRRTAYLILAEKVHVRALTIAQRVRLLQQGLNDRSDCVREACKTKLIKTWLTTYKSSPIELLNCLDVENSVEVCQQLLREVIFSSASPSALNDLCTDFRALLDERSCVERDNITCETVFYWRCLCEHLRASKSEESEEQLEKLLPNALHFTDYFTSLFSVMKKSSLDVENQLRNEFILQQLIAIFSVLDLADQVCRKRVDTLVRTLLLDDYVSHTIVQSLMLFYVSQQHAINPEECVTSLAEIISDIREPIVAMETVAMDTEHQRQRDLKVATLRVELNQLRDELEECVQHQDFSRAAEIKERIAVVDGERMNVLQDSGEERPPDTQRVVKDDSLTLLKCLSVVCGMLNEPRINKLYPSILAMLDSLILPSIQNKDPAVRNLAVKALGLCCLRNAEKSVEFMLLFLKASRLDVETVCVTAMRAIFDQLHFYGLTPFNADIDPSDRPSHEKSGNKKRGSAARLSLELSDDDRDDAESEVGEDDVGGGIMSLLTEQLNSDSTEIRTVCAEGFAKLLLARRIVSPSLLSRLLLHWYNPITEDDVRLRHCLGAFLPIYAFASRQNQSVVAEAFMPTLRTLFEAPETSPLSEVKVTNVAELLVELTSCRHLLNQPNRSKSGSAVGEESCLDNGAHDDIAVSVSNEILSAPNSFNVRVLTRVLTLLELTSTNEGVLKDLRVLTRKMLKVVKDKTCTRMLTTFQRIVEERCAVFQPTSVLGEESVVADGEESVVTGVAEGCGLKDDAVSNISSRVDDESTLIEEADSTDEFLSMNDSQRIKRASSKQSKPLLRKFSKTDSGRFGKVSQVLPAANTTSGEQTAAAAAVSDVCSISESLQRSMSVCDTDEESMKSEREGEAENADNGDSDDIFSSSPPTTTTTSNTRSRTVTARGGAVRTTAVRTFNNRSVFSSSSSSSSATSSQQSTTQQQRVASKSMGGRTVGVGVAKPASRSVGVALPASSKQKSAEVGVVKSTGGLKKNIAVGVTKPTVGVAKPGARVKENGEMGQSTRGQTVASDARAMRSRPDRCSPASNISSQTSVSSSQVSAGSRASGVSRVSAGSQASGVSKVSAGSQASSGRGGARAGRR